jgi:hypothetical protein
MASIVVNGDTSGAVTLSAPATAGTVTVTLPATSGTMLTTASSTGISGSAISSGTVAEAYGGTGTNTGYYGFKNRLINGACVIDQRNAGASMTATSSSLYCLDRWQAQASQSSKYTVQQNAGSVTPPAGYANYLGVTSSSAYSVLATDYFLITQKIEGFNWADLDWGTASAKSVTLSFWVYSSLTGTFGGSLCANSDNPCYPFSYTISSANTWTQISLTIPGSTSGTWVKNNGVGAIVYLSVGTGSTYLGTAGSWGTTSYYGVTGQQQVVGTNGATWYVTGVQLEKGSTATSFDYRPYGTELALCQRYYEKSFAQGTAPAYNQAFNFTTGTVYVGTSISIPIIPFKVTKRAAPTMVMYGISTSGWRYYAGGFSNLSAFTGAAMDSYFYAEESGTSGLSLYQSTIIGGNWTASAEL